MNRVPASVCFDRTFKGIRKLVGKAAKTHAKAREERLLLPVEQQAEEAKMFKKGEDDVPIVSERGAEGSDAEPRLEEDVPMAGGVEKSHFRTPPEGVSDDRMELREEWTRKQPKWQKPQDRSHNLRHGSRSVQSGGNRRRSHQRPGSRCLMILYLSACLLLAFYLPRYGLNEDQLLQEEAEDIIAMGQRAQCSCGLLPTLSRRIGGKKGLLGGIMGGTATYVAESKAREWAASASATALAEQFAARRHWVIGSRAVHVIGETITKTGGVLANVEHGAANLAETAARLRTKATFFGVQSVGKHANSATMIAHTVGRTANEYAALAFGLGGRLTGGAAHTARTAAQAAGIATRAQLVAHGIPAVALITVGYILGNIALDLITCKCRE